MAQVKSDSNAIAREPAGGSWGNVVMLASAVGIGLVVFALVPLLLVRNGGDHHIIERTYSSGAVLSGKNTDDGVEVFQIQLSGGDLVSKTTFRDVRTHEILRLDSATIADWHSWGASSDTADGLVVVDLLVPAGVSRETWVRAVYSEDKCIFITITYEGDDACPYEISLNDSRYFGFPIAETNLPPELGHVESTDRTLLVK